MSINVPQKPFREMLNVCELTKRIVEIVRHTWTGGTPSTEDEIHVKETLRKRRKVRRGLDNPLERETATGIDQRTYAMTVTKKRQKTGLVATFGLR
jgi:hypothetical protein